MYVRDYFIGLLAGLTAVTVIRITLYCNELHNDIELKLLQGRPVRALGDA